MKKIAIIGAGFSGLAVTWHLLQSPFGDAHITLFDSVGIGQGTSGIAAGLLHPFSGAHAKLNWKGKEGCQATRQLLSIAAEALQRPVIAKDKGILRIALTESQLIDFKRCADNFPDDTAWLDSDECQARAPGCANSPGLWIKEGLTIYSALYLEGLWKACQQRGVQFVLRTISSMSELQEFDIVIAATGAETSSLQECASIKLNKVKGQVLELSWPEAVPPLTCALNSQTYLLMTQSGKSCLVGATYEKGHVDSKIDLETAKKELLPKALELFPPLKEAKILNCYGGMRGALPQHKPVISRLSAREWVLTGMGSKGLLYHALFAQELVKMMTV